MEESIGMEVQQSKEASQLVFNRTKVSRVMWCTRGRLGVVRPEVQKKMAISVRGLGGRGDLFC